MTDRQKDEGDCNIPGAFFKKPTLFLKSVGIMTGQYTILCARTQVSDPGPSCFYK